MLRSLALAAAAIAAAGAGPAIPDQDWGFVAVRPGAHMFWLMYGAADAAARNSLPLVIFCNGGPGAGSSGIGAFQELGPYDMNLQPRNTTWIAQANVLFLDSPVGAGFSYVDDLSLLTTDVAQIATDFMAWLAAFLQRYPQFTTLPVHIVSESYGGKMASVIAQALLQGMDSGAFPLINLQGVALGDSWISGADYVSTWGPWLRMLSVMDAYQLNTTVQPAVDACLAAVAAGNWAEATNQWGNVEDAVGSVTDEIDWYNVLLHNSDAGLGTSSSSRRRSRQLLGAQRPAVRGKAVQQPGKLSKAALSVLPAGVQPSALAGLKQRHLTPLMTSSLGDPLTDFMNSVIKPQLGINSTWGAQSDAVFTAQSGDFMRPVVDVVDWLLSDGRLKVTVYNGQLDLICCTAGTEQWMQRLQWSGMPQFQRAAKVPLYAQPGSGQTSAFVKRFQTLGYFTIMDAGHMVPADNGAAALLMLKSILAPAQ